MKTLAHVVSHGPHCLDGVAAAVAVARYQAGRADVETRFAGNNEVDAVLRSLACAPGREHELWITDISWREPETDEHLTRLPGPAAYEDLVAIDADVTYTPRMAEARDRVAAEIAHSLAVGAASRVERRVGDVTLVAAVCDGHPSEVADAWRQERRNAVFAL